MVCVFDFKETAKSFPKSSFILQFSALCLCHSLGFFDLTNTLFIMVKTEGSLYQSPIINSISHMGRSIEQLIVNYWQG